MEACESSEKITDKEDREQIEVTPNAASDQCAEDGDSFGALKSAERDGLVFDKCTIESTIVSQGVSGSRLNINGALDSRKFEFDISGLNGEISIELDSNGSPADELFYKARLLPLHVPVRIQMVEKLEKMVCSEIRPCQQNLREAYAGTQTANIGNRKNISRYCSGIDRVC
jgi:hypothetical protein